VRATDRRKSLLTLGRCSDKLEYGNSSNLLHQPCYERRALSSEDNFPIQPNRLRKETAHAQW
jgi:hypothetical protein